MTEELTHAQFDELQQAIVSNIASQAFIRGKIEGLRNFSDYFKTFKSKFVSTEDLQKALDHSILLLQEGLK